MYFARVGGAPTRESVLHDHLFVSISYGGSDVILGWQ